jgi:ribulose bisphosphate carboxylase small subunit
VVGWRLEELGHLASRRREVGDADYSGRASDAAVSRFWKACGLFGLEEAGPVLQEVAVHLLRWHDPANLKLLSIQDQEELKLAIDVISQTAATIVRKEGEAANAAERAKAAAGAEG